MKFHRSIFALCILSIGACSAINGNRHVSPSGNYCIDYYEAQSVGEADQDSYYQIVNIHRPDFQYSSLGGATRLDDNSIFWSPTERTCLIHENRFGPTRILHLVVLPANGDREYYEIHMRPLEKQLFRQQKIQAVSLSDEGAVFQLVDNNSKIECSIKNLIAESQRQGSIYLPEEELRD